MPELKITFSLEIWEEDFVHYKISRMIVELEKEIRSKIPVRSLTSTTWNELPLEEG